MKLVKMKFPRLFLILLSISVIAFAQVERKPSPAKQADSVSNDPGSKKMDRLSRKDIIRELDLTREQKIKLKEIRQANMAKKETNENNSQLPDSEKKTQLRELQKQQAQNMRAILTDEQKREIQKQQVKDIERK